MPSPAATCSSGSPTNTSAVPMFGVVAVKRSTRCVPELAPPSMTLHWLMSSSRMSQEWASFLASTVRSGSPSRSGTLPTEANAGVALAVVRSRLLQALASSAAPTTSRTYERIETPLGGTPEAGCKVRAQLSCGPIPRRRGVRATGLVRRRVMLLALEREKLVNRADRGRVPARDPHFPTARPIDRLVADRRAALAHYRRAGHGLGVYLERFREVACAERGLNVPHVCANRRDGGRVGGIIAIEDDAPAVRQILKDVRGGVLVDTHDMGAAGLHRGEIVVRPFAGRDYEGRDAADDSDR